MTIEAYLRKEVIDLPAYHLKAHAGIKLNQNESPWDIPVELKATIIENLLKTPWNRYPLEDTLALKKKAAKYFGVWPDSLVFANGSNVLIQALVMATSMGQTIMTVDPTFSVYELEGHLFGNKVHRFALENDFSIDRDHFLKEMKKIKPRIIFIANPNAPTGNLFEEDTLRAIIEKAPCPVVIDEAYYPFSGVTLIDWIKDYDHLAILRTFSKAFSLGGVRLGFMAADPEFAINIEKCLLPFCISKLTHLTAMTILDHPEYVTRFVKTICAQRDVLHETMTRIPGVKTFPSNTNFILFQVSDASHVFNELIHKGVIVRQVSDGRSLKNTLRVTVGSPEENKIFLHALEHAVAALPL